MGDIAQALGLAKPKVAVNPQAAVASAPANPISALLSAAVPAAAPTPEGNAAIIGNAPVAAPPEDAITVTGDAWHPKKPTFLGGMVDGYLMSHGMKPVFSTARDQKNVTEALADYGSDPRAALKRLMMIPGHQAEGLSAYNQLADNERADKIMARGDDLASLKYQTRLGGWLGAIQSSKNPADQYSRMLPQLKAYAAKYGLPDDLPDNYDPDALNVYVNKNVDPEDQLKIEATADYRDRRLNQIDQTIHNTKDYRDARLGQMAVAEGDRNTRAARLEAGRNARFDAAHPKPRVIQTPNGPMTLSTTGNRGMIGDQKWEKVSSANGKSQWRKVP